MKVWMVIENGDYGEWPSNLSVWTTAGDAKQEVKRLNDRFDPDRRCHLFIIESFTVGVSRDPY